MKTPALSSDPSMPSVSAAIAQTSSSPCSSIATESRNSTQRPPRARQPDGPRRADGRAGTREKVQERREESGQGRLIVLFNIADFAHGARPRPPSLSPTGSPLLAYRNPF